MIQEVLVQKPLVICPTCRGTGQAVDQKCQVCRGYGQGLWLEDKFVYWSKKISLATIALDEVKLLVQNLVNGALILVAVLGIVALAYFLLRLPAS